MTATKTINLCTAFLFLSFVCKAQVSTTIRQYVLGKDFYAWDKDQYSMVASFAGINQISELSIFIEDDGYKIPVHLLKRDMNAEKRFLDMNLQLGDTLRIIGRGSMIRFGREQFKGLVDAVIFRETAKREQTIPEAKSTSLDVVFDKSPTFKGKDVNEFAKWVNRHLRYPEIAKENGVQGRVTAQFTVDEEGQVTDVRILRGVDESLDKEALRVISLSPRWEPATRNGEPVSVTFTFPVIFGLR